MKKTLICIPTCVKNREYLDKCLKAVLDNTKDDEYSIMLVKNDYKGFSYAINHGIKTVRDLELYDSIVLLNDDTQVKEGWLEHMRTLAGMKVERPIGIVGATYVREDHVPFWCVYITKEVIQQVGLLDERFKIGEWEDVDYCIRTKLVGYEIVNVTQDVCSHDMSQTVGNLTPEQDIEKKKNKDRFREKWKNTPWGNRW